MQFMFATVMYGVHEFSVFNLNYCFETANNYSVWQLS